MSYLYINPEIHNCQVAGEGKKLFPLKKNLDPGDLPPLFLTGEGRGEGLQRLIKILKKLLNRFKTLKEPENKIPKK
jgi:hypothetical protein